MSIYDTFANYKRKERERIKAEKQQLLEKKKEEKQHMIEKREEERRQRNEKIKEESPLLEKRQEIREICELCKKPKKEIALSRSTNKYICHTCYKRYLWKPTLIKCKRCERMRVHQAKGFCQGCYNSLFHIERARLHNVKRYHNIDAELYKKITSQCVICSFDKIVELHHVDLNHKNNSEDNLVGVCPNHHKMIHNRDFRREIFTLLKEKGYNTPPIYHDDDYYKNL